MRRLIGFAGRQRVGKDTAGKVLMRHGFERVALADPIYEFLYKQNPIISPNGATPEHSASPLPPTVRLQTLVDKIGWEEAKSTYDEVRQLLIATGEELRGILGESVWVNHAEDRIRAMLLEGRDIVVTDIRKRVECDMVHALGGAVVLISSPRVPKNPHPIDDVEGLPVDMEIANDGTIEDFEWKIDAIPSWLRFRHG